MQKELNTNNERLQFTVRLKTRKESVMRIVVFDKNRPNSVYTNATVNVANTGKFIVKMPQSPTTAIMQIYDSKTGLNVTDAFAYDVIKSSLSARMTVNDIENPKVRNFVKFAQEFSERAGDISARNSIYMDDSGTFRIDYVDVCRDRKSGKELTTPARISRERGVIEVSKKYFETYTIPARIAILLHEFSHFYLNARMSDETEADLNALLIYLSLGYSKQEAERVFLKVFYNAPTDSNRKRFEAIDNMIKNFDKVVFTKVGYYS